MLGGTKFTRKVHILMNVGYNTSYIRTYVRTIRILNQVNLNILSKLYFSTKKQLLIPVRTLDTASPSQQHCLTNATKPNISKSITLGNILLLTLAPTSDVSTARLTKVYNFILSRSLKDNIKIVCYSFDIFKIDNFSRYSFSISNAIIRISRLLFSSQFPCQIVDFPLSRAFHRDT